MAMRDQSLTPFLTVFIGIVFDTFPRVQKTRSDDNLIIQIALVLLENYGLPALPVLAL